MKETVWGMIGCGDVTEKKSGPGLYKTNGSRLKGYTIAQKPRYMIGCNVMDTAKYLER